MDKWPKLKHDDLVALIPADAYALFEEDPEKATAKIEKGFIDRNLVLPMGVKVAWKKKPAKKVPKKVAKKAKAKAPMYSNWRQAIRAELYKLICTNDKRYAQARKSIGAHGSKATVVIVGIISAAIANSLGILAGVVSPIVSVFLLVLAQVGKNSWCGTMTPP